ncbi:uncharacterized protein LOC122868655 isoform X2 [Scomber scombrus]|uniref:Uncharacterized protein LOC122868655 isoform X2 n=1 Tax=Scomber scombrus TaxID=13677 RepID=A0AAV1NU58_SCOSC
MFRRSCKVKDENAPKCSVRPSSVQQIHVNQSLTADPGQQTRDQPSHLCQTRMNGLVQAFEVKPSLRNVPLSTAAQSQDTPKSATGLTMPQPTQHSLIHVLLLWTTILSIIQAVFIVLFFTGGHHGNHMLLPSEYKQGKMLSFRSTEASRTVKWMAISTGLGLLSENGNTLEIMKDGYYFLTFQVTLSSCTEKMQTVKLNWNIKVLLQGTINRNTSCSTGLLGKVEELSAGDKLEVIIDPPATKINTSESLTHLNVIYMLKP